MFLREAAAGGTVEDLVAHGLTQQQATTRLGAVPWDDDVAKYGRSDDPNQIMVCAKSLPVKWEGYNCFVVVTIVVYNNFRQSVGRGPVSMVIDTEIGIQDMLDGGIDTFLYHNERPIKSGEYKGSLERMKAFIDSKSIADLYAIERSGDLHMSKYRDED
jgi:hypothetical protein